MHLSNVRIGLIIGLVLSGGGILAQQTSPKSPVATGPYLGQSPPGLTPVMFAPEIVSTDAHEFSCALSPDGKEFYFTRRQPGNEGNRIMVSRWENTGWTVPQVVPKAGEYEAMEPSLSLDGRTLFFQSWRPSPDAAAPSMDIWSMTKTDTGWADPKHLDPPFNPGKSMYINMAAAGTIYTTDISRGMGTGTIVATHLKGDTYEPFTPLPSIINATGREIYPCIGPDESFLLFTRANEDRTAAIYISFRQPDKTWSEPRKLDLGGSTAVMPRLSPDGKYLFFTSMSEKSKGDIYWVDAAIIESLRPKQ